ncbi:A/G-specific adenine glycosylase [Sphingobacterium sp. SGG-5]|uniref:A/G-specific adenine glycosylase n=1 Tax=Sphingobacterium sp. SGG-5 TaxID=2710881 RepID=UPI0013EC3CD5|nr:A/G-specific adenine glycosylase [Sphingobacterium sp. SGG-5]NGM63194.1 A/G-specific adenine glycosylase [Sphingobacterium sp. SGG-5]
MTFAETLVSWYRQYGRNLPWRETVDPYIIWLSEVILQQTRVDQGLPYYHRFVERFPTVEDFASAEEEEVLRLWQGLGYYSRARNMHKAAKEVISRFGGIFPAQYDELITLPGVGDYTAAAIASFSSNEHRAVLDGNVFRVLSRIFGIDTPINSTEGKKVFKELADELLPVGNPGEYNHAIMDFGAIHCKPKAPLCATCVFRLECRAFLEEKVHALPVKLKGRASRNRYFHYFIVEADNHILLSKRGEGDVWTNLYEFPMIETSEDYPIGDIAHHADYQRYFGDAAIEPVGGVIKHILSHQNIFARFYRLEEGVAIKEKKTQWNYFLLEKIDTLAKHKLIFTFWDKYRKS